MNVSRLEVENVLNTPKLDQSNEWNHLINKYFGEPLKVYKKEAWLGTENFEQFTLAAFEHREFVMKKMTER
jgi:hypothetical protein